MVVLILERVPQSLRGELTRWLLEPKAGVFVGRVTAMVRDKLWEKACSHAKGGGCLMIHNSDNEQGYLIRSWGDTSRAIEDFEGLFLVRVP
jgi:CRISPR-associated protein Cas2